MLIHTVKQYWARKSDNCDALQLDAYRSSCSGLLAAEFVVRMRRNCFFKTYVSNSDIVIIYCYPDILKKGRNSTLKRRYECSLYYVGI